MAFVLDASAGGVASNTYVTMAAANTYLQERPHPEPWFDYPPSLDAKIAALMMATRLLDEQIRWYGTPATSTQALAWPMQGQRDRWGTAISPTIVPTVIQRATAIYALYLLRDTSEAQSIPGSDNALVKSRKVGDLTIVYQTSSATQSPIAAAVLLPAEVRQMLAPYGQVAGGINVPLLRV
jgi:hypothetical protein